MKSLKTVFLLIIAFLLTSCHLFKESSDVITTLDNVKPEYRVEAEKTTPLAKTLLPEEVFSELEKAGKSLVVVPLDWILDEEKPKVALNKPIENNWDQIIGLTIDVAKVFFPGLVGLEAIGILLSRRKRDHYKDMIASLTPYDGTVDVKESMLALAKALGFAHSSEKAKQAFEEEVKA
jgi:hypothetical protein